METIEQTVEGYTSGGDKAWSPHTQRTYAVALNKFIEYLQDVERIPPTHPTPALTDLAIPRRYVDSLAPIKGDSPNRPGELLGEQTYRLYLTALAGYYRHLFRGGHLPGVDATEFQQMMDNLDEWRKASTRNRWLEPEAVRGTPPDDLLERLIHLAKAETPPEDVQDEQDLRLFELRRLRTAALLEVLRSTGARINEVLALDVGDVRLDAGRIRLRKETTKGEKPRAAFLDQRAGFALRVYLMETGASQQDDPVFCRHDKRAKGLQRLSDRSAQAEIRRLRGLLQRDIYVELIELLLPQCGPADRERLLAALDDSPAGWPDELAAAVRRQPGLRDEAYRLKDLALTASKLTPHSFRHYFITRVIRESNGNIAAAQDLAGHSRPDTTRGYAKEMDEEWLREVHSQVFS